MYRMDNYFSGTQVQTFFFVNVLIKFKISKLGPHFIQRNCILSTHLTTAAKLLHLHSSVSGNPSGQANQNTVQVKEKNPRYHSKIKVFKLFNSALFPHKGTFNSRACLFGWLVVFKRLSIKMKTD